MPRSEHGRHAILFAGATVLHVFEVPGYDPAAHGIGSTMFERGRLDHLGFTVADEAALGEVRDRLVAAGASSGEIRALGPTLSVRYEDPDGFEGEIDCFDPAFDPSAIGPDAEVVDPTWLDRAQRVLQSVTASSSADGRRDGTVLGTHRSRVTPKLGGGEGGAVGEGAELRPDHRRVDLGGIARP